MRFTHCHFLNHGIAPLRIVLQMISPVEVCTLFVVPRFKPMNREISFVKISMHTTRTVEKHQKAGFPFLEILRLLSEVGVTDFGTVITKCPFILDLKPKVLIDRILYLSRKRFTREQISLIITKYPQWLLEEIDEVDSRLGAFQTLFGLQGMIILFCASPIHVTETKPRLVTCM